MGRDRYSAEKAQETKQKKSQDMQSDVDEEIAKEAQRIEDRNYQTAKSARLKLEEAAQKQKGTTEEMKRQGEKITQSKKSALRTHEQASRAGELAENIEKESHMFGFSVPFWGGIKKWWSRNRKEERDIEEISKKEGEPEEGAPEGVSDENEPEGVYEGGEYIPGQKKTDSELYRILHSVRKINKEAQSQSKLAKKQKVDLGEISKVNEYSKKKVDKTEEQLKKGM